MKKRKKKKYFSRGVIFLLCLLFSVMFLLPTVLTITNSFMSEAEIKANYGMIFSTTQGGYVSKTVNLKFIPDQVTLSQYITGLIKSPDYLLKLWNSILLVVPIVLLQVSVASVAAYSFTRWRGKIRSGIFFFYVVNIVCNYKWNIKFVSQSNQFFCNNLLFRNTVVLKFNIIMVRPKKILIFKGKFFCFFVHAGKQQLWKLSLNTGRAADDTFVVLFEQFKVYSRFSVVKGVFVAERAELFQIFRVGGEDAAFALDHFEHHGAGLICHGVLDRLEVVEGHLLEAHDVRLEALAVFGSARRG